MRIYLWIVWLDKGLRFDKIPRKELENKHGNVFLVPLSFKSNFKPHTNKNELIIWLGKNMSIDLMYLFNFLLWKLTILKKVNELVLNTMTLLENTGDFLL